jgi:hypothetical protein
MSGDSARGRSCRDLLWYLQRLEDPRACATSSQQLEEIMLEWLRRTKL